MADRCVGLIERLLDSAGIRLNGPDPWDFQVRDRRVFARIVAQGSLGLGEAYMDGWWECGQLDEFFHRALRAELQYRLPHNLKLLFYRMHARWLNRQTPGRAFIPAQVHYDLGNDLFEATFDRRLTGSCGYWRHAQDLDAAHHDAGQFYWGRGAAFRSGLAMFAADSVAIPLPRHRVCDIDTPEDWTRAELMRAVLVATGEIGKLL